MTSAGADERRGAIDPRPPARGLRPELLRVLSGEFGDDPAAPDLFAGFLRVEGQERAPTTHFIEMARGGVAATRWALRRAAVLMVESRLLELDADDSEGIVEVLRAIAADPSSGLRLPPGPAALAEGYTRGDTPGFARELRARLMRHDRVHRGLRGPATSADALRDFLALARDECRLTLARYVFTPHEVAGRVLDSVRATRGFSAPFEDEVTAAEAGAAFACYPAYERAILEALAEGSRVLWVGPETPSRLNGLVEYPAGTVVLVVKPPGSHHEFEFKRAGAGGTTPCRSCTTAGGGRFPRPIGSTGGACRPHSGRRRGPRPDSGGPSCSSTAARRRSR